MWRQAQPKYVERRRMQGVAWASMAMGVHHKQPASHPSLARRHRLRRSATGYPDAPPTATAVACSFRVLTSLSPSTSEARLRAARMRTAIRRAWVGAMACDVRHAERLPHVSSARDDGGESGAGWAWSYKWADASRPYESRPCRPSRTRARRPCRAQSGCCRRHTSSRARRA